MYSYDWTIFLTFWRHYLDVGKLNQNKYISLVCLLYFFNFNLLGWAYWILNLYFVGSTLRPLFLLHLVSLGSASETSGLVLCLYCYGEKNDEYNYQTGDFLEFFFCYMYSKCKNIPIILFIFWKPLFTPI